MEKGGGQCWVEGGAGLQWRWEKTTGKGCEKGLLSGARPKTACSLLNVL